MWRWRIANWMSTPRRIGMLPARIEILAFFPLLSIGAAAIWDRGVAEIAGIVLPTLLIIDLFIRLMTRDTDENGTVSVDTLTDLPTRVAITKAIATLEAVGENLTTACIFLRIDGHDSLAQRWGMEERDEIITSCAQRLRAAIRAEDIVARIDDGTFGILLQPKPANRRDDAEALATRVAGLLREPIPISGGKAQISASVGIATTDQVSPGDLLKSADAAVTEAQSIRPGSSRIFSDDLKHRMTRDTALSRSVDQALKAGEIRAWFQPQVCTDTAEIIGFEALARWHHPTLGLLAPGQFLDAIQNAGCLPRLGETMLQNALAALASWDRKGIRIPSISVNFSPEELRDPQLAERIKWEVDRHEMRPARITVEILESVAALGQDDQILRNIDQLASHGFQLDLDDFGTGQASIQNIRRFRVQRIKIDRSFVTGIDTDPEQQAVVAAILSLAQHLAVDTVAEGVETPDEYSILAQLGCQAVQGYGIARPMPFEQTFAWIEGHKARAPTMPVISRKTG